MTKPASTPLLALGALSSALLLASTAAYAEVDLPVELSFTGTVSPGSNMPGVDAGDTVTLNVFANNGGTTLDSQNWFTNEVTGATINVTNASHAVVYSASTSGPLFPSSFAHFSTNASGHLDSLVVGIDQPGSDSLGTHSVFAYLMDAANPVVWIAGETPDLSLTQRIGVASGAPSPSNTSISVVPLPATLPLFATGLGALGLLGWRRKRRARGIA